MSITKNARTEEIIGSTSTLDLSAANAGISALGNVVEDATPQLGGDLDINGNEIITAANSSDNLIIRAGTTNSGAGTAVDVFIFGGDMGDGATGLFSGTVNIQGGDDTRTSGFNRGGNVDIGGGTGTASTSGIGGTITLDGGNADTTGGSIILNPGIGAGTTPGIVRIGTTGGGTTSTAELHFTELTSNGNNYVGFKAPTAISANQIWILPEGGQASPQVLGVDLGEFTVANLPSASTYPNCWALATDASGGRTVVRSDGTNWKVVVVEGATVTT